MAKTDSKKVLKHLYTPSATAVSTVEVPPMNFLMIDGHGNPNTAQAYAEAVEALYAVAYALKFKVKQRDPALDYVVMPLEGLWWVDDMSKFSVDNKDAWDWTMMIMQPDIVTAELFREAVHDVAKKKKLPELSSIRFESFDEGRAAQILHIGSYADEAPTVAKLHEFIDQHRYILQGKHHEIYVGDPRKVASAKLHTVIRQPID